MTRSETNDKSTVVSRADDSVRLAVSSGLLWRALGGWNTPLQDVKDDSPGTTIVILIISVIAAFLAGFYFVRGLDSRQYSDASELTESRHESEIKQ
jgi:nitrogen fixation-related uncharacterized protein